MSENPLRDKGVTVIDAEDIRRYAQHQRVTADLEIEYVHISRVQQHPDNPNNGDTRAIAESIETNGLYSPLIVQRSTGYILAGNHRYQALVGQAASDVPVIYLDVDDERAQRIMIADNRTNRLGFDDPGLLAEMLEGLYETDGGLAGTGYGADEYLRLLDEVSADPTPEPEEDVPDEPEDPDVPTVHPMRFWIEPDIDVDEKVYTIRVTKHEGKPITARDFNTIRQALGYAPATLDELMEYGVPTWGKTK